MPQRMDRARLIKLVKNSKPGKYKPNINDIVYWYDNLNEHIFDDELPTLQKVHILKKAPYWAETHCKKFKDGTPHHGMKFSPDYKSFKEFLEILAHEMVHVWEFKTYGYMGHEKHFHSMAPKLKRFGLDLNIAQ